MSRDPQSPSDAADMHEDDEADGFCCDCCEPLHLMDYDVEAFERFNAVLCSECFANRCEDESDDDEEPA